MDEPIILVDGKDLRGFIAEWETRWSRALAKPVHPANLVVQVELVRKALLDLVGGIKKYVEKS